MENTRSIVVKARLARRDRPFAANGRRRGRGLAMPCVDSRPLRGWRFLLLNIVLGLGNVVVLSNVPGYTVLSPYAAGSLQGVTPSFGTWATTDHMMGIALGFALARWLAAQIRRLPRSRRAPMFFTRLSRSFAP